MNLFSEIRDLVIAALTDMMAQGVLPAGLDLSACITYYLSILIEWNNNPITESRCRTPMPIVPIILHSTI